MSEEMTPRYNNVIDPKFARQDDLLKLLFFSLRETCMKYQSLFPGENISNCCLLIFLLSLLSVKAVGVLMSGYTSYSCV